MSAEIIKKFIGVILSIAVATFTCVVYFSNLDYFDSINSFANVIVTVVILGIIILASIPLAFLNKDKRIGAYIAFVSSLFLVIPIRGLIVSKGFNPVEKLTISYVNYQKQIKTIDITLRYYNGGKTNISKIVGSLNLYNENGLVARYDVSFEASEFYDGASARYTHSIDDLTYEKITDANYYLTYTLKSVSFTTSNTYSYPFEEVRLR